MHGGPEDQARRLDIRSAMAQMTAPMALSMTTTPEDSFLMMDAVRCYRAGADVGAVFCAHASCERDLAAMLRELGAAPSGSQMWGLGKLIAHMGMTGPLGGSGLPASLAALLTVLNGSRKSLYHYGHSDSSNAITRRTSELISARGDAQLRDEYRNVHGIDGRNKDVYGFAMTLALREMALEAVTTAMLLKSWIGEKYGL